MPSDRHRWGDPDRPSFYLTIRICSKCQMRKLTHHQGTEHWVTFELADGTKLASEGLTPICRSEQVAA